MMMPIVRFIRKKCTDIFKDVLIFISDLPYFEDSEPMSMELQRREDVRNKLKTQSLMER